MMTLPKKPRTERRIGVELTRRVGYSSVPGRIRPVPPALWVVYFEALREWRDAVREETGLLDN